jgi:hypothetical protein
MRRRFRRRLGCCCLGCLLRLLALLAVAAVVLAVTL